MLDAGRYGYLPIPEVERAALESFSCGKTGLDDFLKETALAQHKARLGLTSVVFHEDFKGPVGFFTLANDAIPLEESERFDLGIDEVVMVSAIPAVKIGRLAVHQDLQGNGVGAFLINLIIGDALNSVTLSTGRLLVVDADNDERVLSFYQKSGFVESLWAKNRARNNTPKAKRGAAIKMHRDILQ